MNLNTGNKRLLTTHNFTNDENNLIQCGFTLTFNELPTAYIEISHETTHQITTCSKLTKYEH